MASAAHEDDPAGPGDKGRTTAKVHVNLLEDERKHKDGDVVESRVGEPRSQTWFLAVGAVIGVIALGTSLAVQFSGSIDPEMPKIPGLPSLSPRPEGIPTGLPTTPGDPTSLPTELPSFSWPADPPTGGVPTDFELPTDVELPTDLPGLPGDVS